MEMLARLGLLCACVVLPASALNKYASCTISKDSGLATNPIEGTIILSQKADGTGDTTISINLQGFNTTDQSDTHGFHIHMNGDLDNGCVAAGGHYNPDGVDHAGPTDDIRHVGDLGNVVQDADGKLVTTLTDSKVSLSGDQSVIGRAIVVHLKEDDLGKGTGDLAEESKKTGNAGARIACCVIKAFVTAKCEIKADSGNESYPITGSVDLAQSEDGGDTMIQVDLSGFPADAQHGFHIHQEGELTNGCVDAKGHYNPFSKLHGGPTSPVRHVGDLGNVQATGGKVEVTLTDSQVSLVNDTYNVIGRAVVVHAGVDDLGTGGDDGSTTTGNAGGRIACCKITATDDETDGATVQSLHPALFALLLLFYALLRL